jgi:hypothetical protein
MDHAQLTQHLDLFETLQETLWEWQRVNFGEQPPPRHALLGMCEEAGELVHAVLKLSQGIRGSAHTHREAMLDAMGDIVVYLTDLYRRLGMGYLEVPPEFFQFPQAVETRTTLELETYAFEVCRAVADIGTDFEPFFHYDCLVPQRAHDPIRASAAELVSLLTAVAGILGVPLFDCVQAVWDTALSKRNWVSHPHTGGVHQEEDR